MKKPLTYLLAIPLFFSNFVNAQTFDKDLIKEIKKYTIHENAKTSLMKKLPKCIIYNKDKTYNSSKTKYELAKRLSEIDADNNKIITKVEAVLY